MLCRANNCNGPEFIAQETQPFAEEAIGFWYRLVGPHNAKVLHIGHVAVRLLEDPYSFVDLAAWIPPETVDTFLIGKMN